MQPAKGFITPSEKQYESTLSYSSSERGTNPRNRGFTLIEMMVVLAIIVIITSIALTGQASFNRSLVLTDTAYTIAFSVREAQSLGISSRRSTSAQSGLLTTQNAGYGIHFSSGNLASYALFSDLEPDAPGDAGTTAAPCPGHSVSSGPEAKPGDCVQENAAEIVRSYSLNSGFKIRNFCGTTTSGTKRCSDSSGSNNITSLDIVYLRPNTQSVITGTRNGTKVGLTDAIIRVESPDKSTVRCIYVSQVGQVSVHQVTDTQCQP